MVVQDALPKAFVWAIGPFNFVFSSVDVDSIESTERRQTTRQCIAKAHVGGVPSVVVDVVVVVVVVVVGHWIRVATAVFRFVCTYSPPRQLEAVSVSYYKASNKRLAASDGKY